MHNGFFNPLSPLTLTLASQQYKAPPCIPPPRRSTGASNGCVPRPEWDMRTLDETGFTDICCDTRISDRIYTEVDEIFNPVPMFRLTAGKPG